MLSGFCKIQRTHVYFENALMHLGYYSKLWKNRFILCIYRCLFTYIGRGFLHDRFSLLRRKFQCVTLHQSTREILHRTVHLFLPNLKEYFVPFVRFYLLAYFYSRVVAHNVSDCLISFPDGRRVTGEEATKIKCRRE